MDIFGVYLKQDVKVNAGCENLVYSLNSRTNRKGKGRGSTCLLISWKTNV